MKTWDEIVQEAIQAHPEVWRALAHTETPEDAERRITCEDLIAFIRRLESRCNEATILLARANAVLIKWGIYEPVRDDILAFKGLAE